MIMVDNVDDRQFLCELVESMWEELPEKKKKNIQCFLKEKVHKSI